MPGPVELIIILGIVLLIFGAGKLPAIGDALGRSIKNFRRSASGNDEIEVSKKGVDVLKDADHAQLKAKAKGDAFESDVDAEVEAEVESRD